jgi:SP family myo-inositol transporter-like MFS transporter 13
MPESPRHLVKKEKYSEAYAVLSSIRGPYHQVQDELEDMKVSCTSSTTPGFLSSLKSILTSPTARKSVFLGCMLQFVQQAAGINTVMYYAASILSMAGANHGQAVWLSAVTAAVNFIFTLVGIYLVARWTRRRLLFSSLLSVTVSLLLISVSFEIIASTAPHNSTNMTSHQPALSHVLTEGNVTTHSLPAELSVESVTAVGPIVALLSMCLYLASFAPGMGTLPWTINSEMHPHWCRAQAASLTTSTNWITNLVVSLTFLSLIERIGRPSTFLLYALFSLIGYIVLYFCLPETKGVALEEVEHLYERHSAPRQSGVYTRIAPRES